MFVWILKYLYSLYLYSHASEKSICPQDLSMAFVYSLCECLTVHHGPILVTVVIKISLTRVYFVVTWELTNNCIIIQPCYEGNNHECGETNITVFSPNVKRKQSLIRTEISRTIFQYFTIEQGPCVPCVPCVYRSYGHTTVYMWQLEFPRNTTKK